MAVKTLFDLVSGALPFHFTPQTLRQYAREELWKANEREACEQALRLCPQLNWQAYLENYPDIKKAGVDPVSHFLENGIFEGRRLSVWSAPPEKVKNHPKVTIIVANYNKELWLEHCLNSLINQTLKEIEIIIVDDASTDESRSIIARLASADRRIKPILFAENRGPHLARKAGVAAATGQYIMFLDSDDYFQWNACAIAYGRAVRGFDMVTSGVEVLRLRECDLAVARHMYDWMNGGAERVYNGLDICESMFVKKAPNHAVVSKIFEAQLTKAAFATMADLEIRSGEDVYEMVALAAHARTMLKIPDKIYNYRMGVGRGVTSDPAVFAKSALEATRIAGPLKELTQASGMGRFCDPLLEDIGLRACDTLINSVPPEEITAYFDVMAENLGIAEAIRLLQKYEGDHYEAMADKFRHYRDRAPEQKTIRTVGIMLTRVASGGITTVVNVLIAGLLDAGYAVTVFVHYASDNDRVIDNRARVVYLGTSGDIYKEFSNAQGLINAFALNPVDVLLIHQAIYKMLLFQNILLKYLGIRIICFVHEAFYHELLFPGNYWDIQKRTAMLRGCESVVVLSEADELYYRNQGVNAVYIPNPVPRHMSAASPPTGGANTIAVIGRLGERVKDVGSCLEILREVIRERPWTKMVFIGSFLDKSAEASFYARAQDLGVQNNIQVTGWQSDAGHLIADAALLLSTSRMEAFPMGITEAQALGRPVVMFDLPIAAAVDNPAIIRVAPGDVKAAAREVVTLLSDDVRWRELSVIAQEKMRKFSPDKYLSQIIAHLNTFSASSPVTYYTPEDYNVVMRTLGFYSGNLPPWHKK